MAVTSANVKNVRHVNGTIYIVESSTTTTNTKSSYADAIAFLASTDSDVIARRECHAALRQAGYTGSHGNFGG